MRESETLRGWEGALERWLAPFLSALGREAQRRRAPVYLKGLILPGERKSVEPPAARVAPGGTEQLHHLIGGSPWATGPLEAVLAEEADRPVGVLKVQNVYPAAVGLLWPTAARGRPRKRPVPSEAPVAAEAALAGGRVAPHRLAARHQGAARGRVRRPAGASGRGRAAQEWL